jgi:hypothetical protein
LRYGDILADSMLVLNNNAHFIYQADDKSGGGALQKIVTANPQGRTKKFIIAVFASFFVLVFVAFALNAVENVKNDEKSYNKIKTAWEEGK